MKINIQQKRFWSILAMSIAQSPKTIAKKTKSKTFLLKAEQWGIPTLARNSDKKLSIEAMWMGLDVCYEHVLK